VVRRPGRAPGRRSIRRAAAPWWAGTSTSARRRSTRGTKERWPARSSTPTRSGRASAPARRRLGRPVPAHHPDEQVFTWWDYRGGAFHRRQGLRIDFLLGTQPVVERVKSVEIDRDYRKKKRRPDTVRPRAGDRRPFEKQGPQETKVDDICELADVAQKTFFNHFPTKQHLVGEIAATFLQDFFTTIAELRDTNAKAASRLTALFASLADRCEAAGPMHRELVLEMIRSAYQDRPEAEQAHVIHDAFRSLLEDCRGELRGDHDIETLTEMVVGTYYVLMLNWVSLDDYPLRERSIAAGRFLADALTERSEE
jgi:AcrR family transcriptional regulator